MKPTQGSPKIDGAHQAPSRREALAKIAGLGAACWSGLRPRAALARRGAGGAFGERPAMPSRYKPVLSVEVYIWVQQFQSQHKDLVDGVEEMLSGTQQAGYRNVELSADFLPPVFREKTLALLRKYKLRMPTLYVGTTLHESTAAEKSIREAVDLARAVRSAGLQALVTNPSPKPHHQQKTAEELEVQAKNLNQLGAELRKLGLRLMVHHHTPELVEHGREWRYQLESTDPALVACCVDVDWAFRGGEEPLAFIRETGTRLLSLHLRNDVRGVWREDFGMGDIDYAPLADYLQQIVYTGYLVVELAYEKDTEITRPLVDDLQRSRLYAEKIFDLK